MNKRFQFKENLDLNNIVEDNDSNKEVSKKNNAFLISQKNVVRMTKCDCFLKLRRVMAYAIRFVNNLLSETIL